jgi:hypothetical protein
MRVEYTGRQIEVTPAIQKFTEDHLKKIRKLLVALEVHAILTVEKYRHIAEINLKSTSFKLNGLEEAMTCILRLMPFWKISAKPQSQGRLPKNYLRKQVARRRYRTVAPIRAAGSSDRIHAPNP